MGNKFKKTLAVVLSAALMLSLIPMSVFNVLAFDSIDDFADAPVIALDTETNVSYDGTEPSGAFKFTPASDGMYCFYSSGDYDTYGSIIDSNGDEIKSDDDGGSGSNFKVKFTATAGNTYYLLSRLYNASNSADYTVKLIEYANPVDHVEVAPIQVIKDLSGQVYTDADDNEYFRYEYYNPTYTVYYKDGTEPYTTYYSTYIDGQYYSLEYNDHQDENHWDALGDYDVPFTFAGISSTFTVSVVENPVVSVEIDDVKLIDGQGGYFTHDWDTGEDFYYYNYNAPMYTVTFSDGTSTEKNSGDKKVFGKYFSLQKNADQYSEHWTVGNTYEIPCTFAGVECSFNVSIVANPITRVEIDNIVLNENVNGYESTDSDGQKFYYYYLGSTPEYTVYYDDTQTEKNRYSKTIYGNSYSLSYEINQYERHFLPGQTYEIPCTICGFPCSFNVVVNESPVENVVIDDITVIEGFGGYKTTDSSGRQYYHYNNIGSPRYVVYYKDGTQSQKTSYSTEILPGVYESLSYNIDQYNNHLKFGNNKFTAEFAGKDYEFNIVVIENPIDYIEFEDIVLYENMGGYTDTDEFGDEYYHYSYNNPQFTLHFKDGTVSDTNSYGKEVNGKTYYLQVGEDYQEEDHWYAGEIYDVDFTFMDITGTFQVTVEENPIARIEIDPITVIKDVNSYTRYDGDGESYDYYYYDSPKYTVYYRDGTQTEKTSGSFMFGGTRYYLEYRDSQSTTHWTTGNTYTIPCTLAGVPCSFDVTVKNSPVTRIVFDEVTVTENVSGYTQIDANGNEYFHYSYSSPKYIAYFDDGTDSGKVSGSFYYNGSYAWPSYNDDQYENHWTVGNTYQVPFSVLGFETSFSVTVKKSPIESVVVDKTVILEETGGRVDTDADGNEYYLYSYRPKYVVNLDDGTQTSKTQYSTQIGDRYYNLEFNDDQYENHWTVGHTYDVPFTFMGYKGTLQVEIKESPVESVVIEPVEVIENISGYTETDGDGNEFFYYSFSPEYTVYFKDGTHTATNRYNKTINGQSMGLTIYGTQYGEHWTVGNTYDVTYEFMGIQTTSTVTVVPNPIVSVTVDDISIIENNGGYTNTDGDGNEFFYYDEWYFDPQYTLTFNNGKTVNVRGSYQVGDSWYSLEFETDQFENHWTVGNTYNVRCTFMGVESSFNATIVENPVLSVTVNDVTVIENGLGYYTNDRSGQRFFYYTNFYPTYKIFYRDGTYSANQSGSVRIGNSWYEPEFETDQFENHWTVGNTYEVEYTFMGIPGTFNVTITENPIASLEAADVSLIENTRGYMRTDYNTGEKYFYYNYSPRFNVVYKDGTREENVSGSVKIGDFWYSISTSDTQGDVHWTAGNTYEATATLVGLEANIHVTVTESPVLRVEIEDMSLIENSIGWTRTDDNSIEYFNYDCNPRFKVYFKDGTSSEMSDDSKLIGDNYYSLSDFEDNQYEEHWRVGGTYDVSCKFMGVSGSFKATIVESPVARIEVDDITIIEKIGTWNTTSPTGIRYTEYNYPTPEYTVFFKDGTKTEKSSRGKVIGGQTYWLSREDNQAETPWEVGNTYTVDCEFLGVTSTFNVTVKPISYFAATIPSLVLNTPMTLTYDGSVLSGLTRFTPAADGDYTFYTTGKWLTDGTLYDANGEMVAYDYGDEQDYNFRIETQLRAGQVYYLLSEGFPMVMADNDTGKYSFNVTVTGSGAPGGCPHSELETRNAKDATCTEAGYSGDVYCTQCDMLIVSGRTIPALGHTGGTATCHSKAVCTRCGNEYGEFNPNNHDGETEIRNAKDATCTEDGYTGDVYCLGCGGMTRGKIIPALGHAGGTATCASKAKCEVCGEEYGEFDPDNHEGETEVRDAVAATCTAAGYTGNTYCLGCGAKISDGRPVPALGHTGGTATCHSKAVCTRCHEEYGEFDPDNHDGETEVRDAIAATCTAAGYTGDTYCLSCGAMISEGEETQLADHTPGDWSSDENGHWRVCSHCQETVDRGAHTYIWKITRQATADEVGLREEICSVCGFKSGNYEDVEYNDHIPGDINGDGKVNNKDLTRLFQYLSDWDVEVNEAALDVNGDGKINNKDLTRLFQYLSDWDVEIF